MKNLSFILVLSLLLFACSSDKKSNEKVGEDVEPYGNVGVENVNGGIPDTTNTIDLSTNKVDSTMILDTPSNR